MSFYGKSTLRQFRCPFRSMFTPVTRRIIQQPGGTPRLGFGARRPRPRPHPGTDTPRYRRISRLRRAADFVCQACLAVGRHSCLRQGVATPAEPPPRPLFHSLSAMNAQYAAAECDRQYDNCLKSHRGGITIATFFQMARDTAGIDLAEMARENVKNGAKCAKCAKRASTPWKFIRNSKYTSK